MRFGGRSTTSEVLADVDLTGKVMLVTGANAGIGFETARALASRGAKVYVACRSLAKANDTAEAIRATGSGGAQPLSVVGIELELSSAASVRACAAAFAEPRLDVLVCNAAVFLPDYAETAEGIEMTVGVAHFGHVLLANLLMPKLLAATPGARVVMVASGSHYQISDRADMLERMPLPRAQFSQFKSYAQAKLLNVLFARELGKRYAARGLVAVSLHPGTMIATSIGRGSLLARFALFIARPFTKSIAQGAATTVMCAARPEITPAQNGTYYTDCAPKTASAIARDDTVAAAMWDATNARLQITWP